MSKISARILSIAILGFVAIWGYQISASADTVSRSATPTAQRSPTLTPTPIPSKVADREGPILLAPADGSRIENGLPDFQFIGLRQSFTHEIYIRNVEGVVTIWTPDDKGMNELSPLPAGDYTWQVCAIGYIDPTPRCSDMIWSFEIAPYAMTPIPTVMASPTATITPLATSELIPVPPLLIAPADGAVLHTALPEFEYEIVPNAQAYEIWINGADDFQAVWVISGFEVTGMYAGYPYTPTPGALPDGDYEWHVCAKRYSSGRGICSTETWTFTVQAQ